MITTFELPLRANSFVASIPFHFQQILSNPFSHDFLKTGNAFRFDFLALRLLFFFEQNESMRQRNKNGRQTAVSYPNSEQTLWPMSMFLRGPNFRFFRLLN